MQMVYICLNCLEIHDQVISACVSCSSKEISSVPIEDVDIYIGENFTIESVEDLEYSFTEIMENCIEVSVYCSLPDEALTFYELDNFDITVRFYNSDKVVAHLYDYDAEDYRLEIKFSLDVQKKLIKFAQDYIDKKDYGEDEVVWLCDNCDEMYEEPTSSCEICRCSSIRIVHKTDMGL